MSEYSEDRERFFSRRTDKIIVSRRIEDPLGGPSLRIASRVSDAPSGLVYAKEGPEVVLRRTPASRYEIKATFLEDDRSIKVLTIQRYNSKSGPAERHHFSFVGKEINKLSEFLQSIPAIFLEGDQKKHVTDSDISHFLSDKNRLTKIIINNIDRIVEIFESENLERDLVAVGYRRKQISHFENLLYDPSFFELERKALDCRPEDVWQIFFESNPWIFGYGLSYIFASKLTDKKLEQVVRGASISGEGKRSDAMMKTRGLINSLCFTEIKRHDTPLLNERGNSYRSGTWAPSTELVGGMAQVQNTVNSAIQNIGVRLEPTDGAGNPTGESLFNFEPRSCLVIGSLGQFKTETGINMSKFRSFELFRRNTIRPEIITFDELLERARFIVEDAPTNEFSRGD